MTMAPDPSREVQRLIAACPQGTWLAVALNCCVFVCSRCAAIAEIGGNALTPHATVVAAVGMHVHMLCKHTDKADVC
jgi:hypothetical protein